MITTNLCDTCQHNAMFCEADPEYAEDVLPIGTYRHCEQVINCKEYKPKEEMNNGI